MPPYATRDERDLKAMAEIIQSAVSCYRGNATRKLIDQFISGLTERAFEIEVQSGNVVENCETTYTLNPRC